MHSGGAREPAVCGRWRRFVTTQGDHGARGRERLQHRGFRAGLMIGKQQVPLWVDGHRDDRVQPDPVGRLVAERHRRV